MSKWCVSGWACRSCKFIMVENTDFKVKEQAMLPNEKVQKTKEDLIVQFGYMVISTMAVLY